MHDFFGAVTTDAASTDASLQASPTTCSVPGDTAAYRAPTLYDSMNDPITPVDLKIYYQFINGPHSEAISLPAGLKMIAGNAAATHDNPGHQVASWRCAGGGEQPAVPGGDQHDMAVCPEGRNLQATVLFPDCWNGVDLDSADHKQHVAYSAGGVCPTGYPVKIVQVLEEFEYFTTGGVGVHLASGDPITMHADFWNTWDQSVLDGLVQDCIVSGLFGCDPAPYTPAGP